MNLADRMDAWLESHADRSVSDGARRLVWEDKARWEQTPTGSVLVAVPDDAVVLIRIDTGDFGTTDEFWARVG